MSHELDLAGYALGALEDDERAAIEARLAEDADARAELDAVRRHLGRHDATPRLQALPPLWKELAARVEEEPAPAVSPLRRFWMPAAAAALIAVAFLWPRDVAPPAATVVHGAVARASDGTLTCDGAVARIRAGDGVLVTMNPATSLAIPASERLALRAGLVFLEVAPGRRGFTVEAGDVTVETTGTAFSVRRDGDGVLVSVEEGSVVCRRNGAETTVEAGRCWSPALGTRRVVGDLRDWFTRPTPIVNVLTPDTIRVVLRNDMPDPIQLAPPTAGEPLFLAALGDQTVPLTAPTGHPLAARAMTLRPGDAVAFEFTLPRSIESSLTLTYPAEGLRMEVAR